MADAADRSVRPKGRELALGVLCHLESYPDEGRSEAAGLIIAHPPTGDVDGEDAFARLAADADVRAFAKQRVEYVEGDRERVDRVIRQASQRWRLERMDRVDRNVLRLAVGELLHDAATPRGVILAEAVRLARRYGSERSAAFVNGVLDSIARTLRPDAPGSVSEDGGG